MALLSALVLGAVVLFVPGALLLRRVAGLAWFPSVALAPPLSFGFVAVLGLLPTWLGGIRFWTFAVATGLLALVWFLPKAPTGDPTAGDPDAVHDVRWAWLGAGLGALVTALLWWPVIWPLDAIPQGWDANWHGYVAAVIHQTHVGNPYRLVPLDPLEPGGPRIFYPVGLHLVIALAATGSRNIAPAFNAVQFLLAVVVTPLGAAALARHLLPGRRAVVLAVPVLVALPVTFAARIVSLPPYAASVQLLPALLVLLLLLQRRGWDLRLGAVALLGPLALFAVQPAGAFNAAGLGGLAVLEGLLRRRNGQPLGRELLRLAGWLVAAGLTAAPWALASAGKADGAAALTYQPIDSDLAGAVVNAAQLGWGTGGSPLPWVWPVVLAVWAGLAWLAVRHRTAWPLAGYLLFGALFVVAAGYSGELRHSLTAPWFGRAYRLIPMVTLTAAFGLAVAVALLVPLARRAGPWLRRGAAAAGIAVLLAIWTGRGVPPSHLHLAGSRAPVAVTPGELAAFGWLSRHAPPGSRVLNDWAQGTAWMYATDRVVPFDPYVLTLTELPERADLLQDFDFLDADGYPLDRLARYRLDYLITSGSAVPRSDSTLELPANSPRLREVFRAGDAVVYAIDSKPDSENSSP